MCTNISVQLKTLSPLSLSLSLSLSLYYSVEFFFSESFVAQLFTFDFKKILRNAIRFLIFEQKF